MFSLASAHRLAENVIVLPVVIPKAEFGDVERQILLADLMERVHHAVLNRRPEVFDGVCMDHAHHVFMPVVIDPG